MKTITIPVLVLGLHLVGCAAPRAATFATPEDAVHRLLAAAEDRDAADELLGDGGFALLRSGDDVADARDFALVTALAREKLAFEDLSEDSKIARFGNEGWEFPIPLVREAGAWRFDVEAGREEVLNRRIGRNELSTIETLRALVEAQREYAAQSDGGKPGPFAQRVLSSAGRRDGLYWPIAPGETPSPLGPLVADACEDGYRTGAATPYHGYFYRLLTAQGRNAPGGERKYVDAQGRLSGGFGVLAWPATYGNSGVMSFVVNQQGIVFQCDLGTDTARAALLIQSYDPDERWTPSED
ncbi:MAG: DUF2950 domain-containing protein [Planctomycetota bacterium]